MSKALKVVLVIFAVMLVVGIGLMTAGILTGGATNMYIDFKKHVISDKPNNMIKDELELDDLDSIDLEVAYCDVNIITGDSYKVEYAVYDNSKVDSDYDEAAKTYKFKQKQDDDRLLTVFGNPEENQTPHITITVPEGAKLSDISVKCAYGDIEINGIDSKAVTYDLAHGDVSMSNVIHDDITIDDAYGDIKGSEMIVKNVNIETARGDVELGIKGNETDYNIDLEAALGDIKCNSTEARGNYKTESSSENKIKVDVSAGEIDVDIK